jgi:acyl carrier protein
MYGPTETTVWSTHKLIKSLDDITIGNPISNTDIYILNGDKLMPKNNEGEICIGGDGVGRGYLGKSKRTNLKYVQNIFKPKGKMYRTGDYGYINNNNELVYVGRSDGQVKINGYRVELTEIENIILKYPGINNAVVAKKSINTQDILCGYIISDKEININDLKKHLQELLPIYMVPKYIIQMEEFPYTQNGKIDRKSMPIPKLEDSQEVIVGARNDVDVKLISEITKTLELSNISIDKNLFEIGLDSLLAINLSVYVLNEFGVQISVNSIFNNPTIEQISDLIVNNPSFKGDLNDYIQSFNDLLSIKKSRIEKVKSQDYYEVSDNQRQIYLACQNSPKDSLLYNISGAIEFTQNINIEILKNSLLTLLNRHEAFRTSFDIKDEKIVQIIDDNVSFNIELEKI